MAAVVPKWTKERLKLTILRGKYNGLWQQWYDDGQVKKNVKFVDGKKRW
jgi:antitoxin component YwqK of YwqJK toxin-antitoxin module